ncbi:hypothetical protein GGI12_001018 [Dipsacomyces acuminosporus]|nr:hypothetical protein GGI12_001018 [Dipsacomyces acuminosporus]
MAAVSLADTINYYYYYYYYYYHYSSYSSIDKDTDTVSSTMNITKELPIFVNHPKTNRDWPVSSD